MTLSIYGESSYLQDDINTGCLNLNTVLNRLKNIILHRGYLGLNQQTTLTESDLKCELFRMLYQICTRSACKVYSELCDKEFNINSNRIYTDITIVANQNLHFFNTGIEKSYTISGDYIDIELKYVRESNFNADKKDELKRDLEKLSNLLLRGEMEGHGTTRYGLAIFGFRKLSTLNRYLENGDFINALNNNYDVKTLFLFKEHN